MRQKQPNNNNAKYASNIQLSAAYPEVALPPTPASAEQLAIEENAKYALNIKKKNASIIQEETSTTTTSESDILDDERSV